LSNGGGADAVLTLLGHEDGRTLNEISEIGRSRGDEITDETIEKLATTGLIEIDSAAPRRAHLTGEGRKARIEIVAMLKLPKPTAWDFSTRTRSGC
jgi:3-hydroxy-9,10-secoandrosta-1,3,5(10)-triene-9,17-dione monooxygenase reductase component